MLKKSYLLIIVLIITFFIFILYLNSNKKLRVAHAGGEYNDKTYPNSIDSINSNFQFTKYFELDLQLTKDKRLVCLHDPIITDKYFYEIEEEIIKNDYCYDKILKDLLLKNKKILIITDFKTDNIEGLSFIKDYFKEEAFRFIPQIYYENEYKKVKDLGFDKIIFTLYRVSNYSNDKISKMIKKMDLFALTMDPARLRSGNYFFRYLKYKIFFGADEIYTDNLF